MPSPTSVSENDLLNAIRRYLEGEFRLSEACKSIGLGAPRFKQEMASRGFRVRTPSEGQALRHVRDADTPWKRRFAAAAKEGRESWVYSDANRERFRAYGASRKGKAGAPRTDLQLDRRAAAHERALLKVSPVALTFRDMLSTRGLPAILEKAAGRYNIDIAAGRIAVEVHRYSFNPLGPTRLRERKRTHYLCNRGWLVCYVWVRPADSFLLTDNAADYVVALAEAAERTPSLAGEYRVVRGSGELFATGRGDGDELA